MQTSFHLKSIKPISKCTNDTQLMPYLLQRSHLNNVSTRSETPLFYFNIVHRKGHCVSINYNEQVFKVLNSRISQIQRENQAHTYFQSVRCIFAVFSQAYAQILVIYIKKQPYEQNLNLIFLVNGSNASYSHRR